MDDRSERPGDPRERRDPIAGTRPPADGGAGAPPEDPEEWSHEDWCSWLNETQLDFPDDPAPVIRRSRSAGTAFMGAAMLGIERAMFGKVSKPEVVVEIEADGRDDGFVKIDPDDPAASTINITRPRPD